MPRFRNYYNKRGRHNRIYSLEDLFKMSMGDFIDKEDELDFQDNTIGLPFDDELKLSQNVRFIDGFTQDDGNVIPSRWESFAPVIPQNPIDNTPSLTGEIADNLPDLKNTQLSELLNKNSSELGTIKPYKNNDLDFSEQDDKLPDNVTDVLKQQPQEDTTLSDDLLAQNKTDIGQIKQLEDNKTQNIQTNLPPNLPQNDLAQNNLSLPIQTQQPVEQVEQKEQPQLSQNLKEYIDELLGKQNTPLYPENGVIKGGVETTDIEDNVFRKPIEPIQDFVNKAKNNCTDYSVPKTNWEKVQEKIYTDALKDKLPIATEATENGMKDMSAAKRNPNAKIYNSINDLEDKSLAEKFKKLKTDENIKGVVYDSNSKEAKKISNSKDFNNYVNEIINNDGISQKDSIEFKGSKNIFSKDNDLHYSLQNATIHNPKVSDDGKTFTCKIIDVSDFKKRPTTFMNIPNNWGYNMQEKGQYKNYFQVIEIEVPLTEEQKELLKKRKKY